MKALTVSKSVVFICLVILSVTLFSACKSASPTPAAQTQSTDTKQTTANSITIKDMAFSSGNMQVKVGDTVTWTNQDVADHTATSDTGLFESGKLTTNGTFSFTFKEAGVFPYHCTIHPNMKAVITVVP